MQENLILSQPAAKPSWLELHQSCGGMDLPGSRSQSPDTVGRGWSSPLAWGHKGHRVLWVGRDLYRSSSPTPKTARGSHHPHDPHLGTSTETVKVGILNPNLFSLCCTPWASLWPSCASVSYGYWDRKRGNHLILFIYYPCCWFTFRPALQQHGDSCDHSTLSQQCNTNFPWTDLPWTETGNSFLKSFHPLFTRIIHQSGLSSLTHNWASLGTHGLSWQPLLSHLHVTHLAAVPKPFPGTLGCPGELQHLQPVRQGAERLKQLTNHETYLALTASSCIGGWGIPAHSEGSKDHPSTPVSQDFTTTVPQHPSTPASHSPAYQYLSIPVPQHPTPQHPTSQHHQNPSPWQSFIYGLCCSSKRNGITFNKSAGGWQAKSNEANPIC